MIISTLQTLSEQLRKDERLTMDGNLAKNKITELTLQLDKDFLKLLLSAPEIKKMFFQEVDKVFI